MTDMTIRLGNAIFARVVAELAATQSLDVDTCDLNALRKGILDEIEAMPPNGEESAPKVPT